MRNYRTAFLVGLVVNLLLAALVFGLWRRYRAAEKSAGGPTPQAATAPGAGAAPASPTPAAPSPAEAPLVPVQLSPQRLQSIGVRFAEVESKPVHDEIRAVGNVAVDETRLAYVQVRFSGWIQKVFADATYQYIRKGQPLFTIYSPELVTTEREYLLARKNQQALASSAVPGVAASSASLLDAAAERLKQWGVPDREIRNLESTGQVRRELEIDSPVSGYIIERAALPNLYAQPETRLYTVADLSAVWVFAQVFQNELGRLRVGDPARLTMDAYPGRTFPGRVDFIYPEVDMATRTARVRLVFPNPGLLLKPGMFVNVALDIPMGKQLVIPSTGVFQSGTRVIAFVDRGGVYLEPREIELGASAGDQFVLR
jgi:Cu(I)/Ag(I) efflux system membrane fusion protein/cobalt-zinc-cadmium efflux system membrane fusion protein